MKKLIIPAAAIALACAFSAFTAKRTTGFFYHYTSSLTTQAAIQNVNNYVREDGACDDGSNVCGVVLATDEGSGNQPDITEFNAEKGNLLDAQQNGNTADPNISMKN